MSGRDTGRGTDAVGAAKSRRSGSAAHDDGTRATPSDGGAGGDGAPPAPRAARPVPGWLSRALGLLASLRHAPLTLALVAGLWVVGLATGAVRAGGPSGGLLDRLGVGVPALAAGRWWTPLSSFVLSRGLLGYLATTVLFLLLGAVTEYRLGTARTGLLMLVSQVGGTLVGTGVVALGSLTGEPWLRALDDALAVGPSGAVVGAALGFSYRLTTLWRRRTRLLLVTALLVLALYVGFLSDLMRLTEGLVGLLAGLVLFGPARVGRPLFGRLRAWAHPASHGEARVLTALAVAASAVGPLVATLIPRPIGPLSEYAGFFVSLPYGQDKIQAICSERGQEAFCRTVQAEHALSGLPGVLMAIVPVVLTLVLAEGLRRGRRLAWSLTLLLNLVLILLAVLDTADTVSNHPEDTGGVSSYWAASMEPLVLPVAIIVLLLVTWRLFGLPMRRSALRKLAVTVLAALVAVAAVFLGAGMLARAQFEPHASLGALAGELPVRFLPPGFQEMFDAGLVPEGGAARALYAWCGVAFWLVALVALLLAFRSGGGAAGEQAARARELITGHGGSTLSYLATWPGNDYWFDDDGRAGMAYRVVGTVAVTTGGPFGEPAARAGAVQGFARFCERNGRTPCLYSVTGDIRDAATALGFKGVQVAEDTIVPLPDLKFSGKKWQDVRTSLNKAGKAGITAEWLRFGDAPLALTDQIRSISEEWVSDKGLPEMGFTLGGLDELNDPEVRCLVAVDTDRTVHGVTSWMPVYSGGEPVGWTLDFMRRRSTGFRGVMEFLIASAALGFKEEGAEFLSLSGAPLARLERDGRAGPLQRLLDFSGAALEPVYGFRSLFAFKAKFQPRYEPLYLAYPDPAALPTIANAIVRAYLPHLTSRQAVRLVRQIVRQS